MGVSGRKFIKFITFANLEMSKTSFLDIRVILE